MIRLLQSGWVVALIGAGLYGAVTVALLHPAKFRPNAAGSVVAARSLPRPSWDFVNPELNRLITELNDEKAALAARQQELDDLAARLAAERAELNVVTQAVHLMQQEYDRHVVRVKEEERANLQRLAKTYAAMSAEGAAGILKEMDDDQMVKILVFMKDKEAAQLLESLAQLGEDQQKRVALMTELMRTSTFRDPAPQP